MKAKITALTRKFLVKLCVALLLASIGTGCSVNLKHEALKAPAKTYSDSITTAKSAEGSESSPNGADGRVGWGRGTIFAIPIVPIYVNGSGNELVMNEVRDALTTVGYQVQTSESTAPVAGKELTCKVDRFHFSNYTWLFPIVPTWGGITLDISLIGADKAVLWSHQFSGSGFTFNFFDGYSSAANSSMKDILDAMVDAFSSDDFHAALTR